MFVYPALIKHDAHYLDKACYIGTIRIAAGLAIFFRSIQAGLSFRFFITDGMHLRCKTGATFAGCLGPDQAAARVEIFSGQGP